MRTIKLFFRMGILFLIPLWSIHTSHAADQSIQGATGSIAGKVTGLDLSDIGTAYVEAWMVDMKGDSASGEGTKGLALVDSNFTYRIDNLGVGAFYVVVWADGYISQYFNGVTELPQAAHVTVKENSTTSGIDFRLSKPVPGTGSISGTVLEDPSGKPVEGAVVSVYEARNGGTFFYFGKAATGPDGHYTITGLKSGAYYAQVYADGFVWEMYDNVENSQQAKSIRVDEPGQTQGIDFRIERSGSISGKVTNTSGNPIGKAVVVVYMNSGADTLYPLKFDPMMNVQQSGYTDSDGQFVIDGLKKGKYLVVATIQTDWNPLVLWYRNAATEREADTLNVESGKILTGIDFQFKIVSTTGSISGKVMDKQGSPIANAAVYIQMQSSSNWGGFRYAQTDSQGFYLAEKLPPGDYIVSAWAQIGWRSASLWWQDAATPEQAKTVHVEEGVEVKPIDFRMPLKLENGSIAGTVRSSEGRLLFNATIQLRSAPLSGGGKVEGSLPVWAYSVTDSFGRYTIGKLPAGKYIMTASCWENDNFGQEWYKGKTGEDEADPVTLSEDQKREGIDFTLKVKPVYGTIAGTVTESVSGKPITRASVSIAPLKSTAAFAPIRMWNLSTRTDEKGRYILDRLMEGEYLISVYADGGFAYYKSAPVASLAHTVKLSGGQKVTADVSVPLRNDGKGTISGHVTSYWDWTDDSTDSKPVNHAAGRPVFFKGSPIDMAVITAKPAVTILSYPQSELFYAALADSNGDYTLRGLPPGEYYVSSFAPYHMLEYYNNTTDPAKATLVRIEKDKPVEGVDFTLSPMLYLMRNAETGLKNDTGNSLSGKVEDSSGNAVSGAAVYLLNADGQAVDGVLTGADGSYVITGLPAGAYYVQASKPGYSTQFNGAAADLSQTVPLNVSIGVNEMNFTLKAGGASGVESTGKQIPSTVVLRGCYPNPFNPETRIVFELSERMHAVLRVLNALGQEVTVLCDKNLDAGRHDFEWKGSGTTGQSVPSGIYFFRLETARVVRTGKMILLR